MLSNVPSILDFLLTQLIVFCHERMFNFAKYFFLYQLRWSYDFFLHFVNLVYFIHWFSHVEPFLYPWNKSHVFVVYNSINMVLILFSILLRIFATKFIEMLICSGVFFFFQYLYPSSYEGNSGHKEWIEKSSFPFCGRIYEKLVTLFP